ncbi:energy transducer TonB [uncultured Muribaculum sp.]|uniref:energy transducer TonB n=1 Tax=uncultured Muribaculum sp. TaxID=1918613 RepID=UPI0025D01FC5|nr:energy transducer TonB [uncultured Muribaculum sp.]
MARGKRTCKILKEIRRQIAEANDIEFVTSECRYRGDCLGTCPKCEAEVRYLEEQLRIRQLMGKAVALAGISAGMILMPACSGASSNQSKETLQTTTVEPIEQTDTIDSQDEGELPEIDSTSRVTSDLCAVKTGETEEESMAITIQGDVSLPEDTVAINKNETDGNAPEENKVFGMVGVTMPSFPGGEEKLKEWIYQHMVYPQKAMDDSIQGRVVIQFLVDCNGNVCNIKVARGICEELDNEAMRVAESFPPFNPATMDGKVVECWYTLPITFKILPAD